MPALDGLKVVRSSIHGYGVITTRPFKKGDILCYGDGVLYTKDADFDDTYALIMDDEESGHGDHYFWDLVDQTRWFNHSCDPNTEVMGKWNHETNRCDAWWLVLRDIEVGEEITYDYAFVADVAEPCACGTKNCRGLIIDSDPAEIAKVPDDLRRLLRPQAA